MILPTRLMVGIAANAQPTVLLTKKPSPKTVYKDSQLSQKLTMPFLSFFEGVLILETGSLILPQPKQPIHYAQTVRFTPDSTQPTLTLLQLSEPTFSSFSHYIDQPQFMLLGIA